MRGGRSSGATRSPYSRDAMTSASTPCRARIVSLACRADADAPGGPRPAPGRPARSQRISPPSAVNRFARAWVSRPAPPSGTGKPTVWPSMHISTPISPEPTASSGMSAWPALPARRRRGWSPPNSWLPTFMTGVSSSLTKSAPPAPGRPRSRPGRARTGGKGVSRPLTSESPIRSQESHSRSQAAPSPACRSSISAGGHLTVAVQHRPRPVPERVAEHRGRVPPDQAVLLEPEGRQGPATPRPAGRTR